MDISLEERYNNLPNELKCEILKKFSLQNMIKSEFPISEIIKILVPRNKDPIEYFLERGICFFENDTFIYENFIYETFKRFKVEKGFYKIYIGKLDDYQICYNLYNCGYELVNLFPLKNWIKSENDKLIQNNLEFNKIEFNSHSTMICFKPFDTWKNKKYTIIKKYNFDIIIYNNEFLGIELKKQEPKKIKVSTFETLFFNFTKIEYKLSNKTIGYALCKIENSYIDNWWDDYWSYKD